MSFTYLPDTDTARYNREAVKFLPNTPRNPADFHDMQDILRHRQVRLVDELYGNCRINTGVVTPYETIGTAPNQRVSVNGIFYFDGYRLLFVNKESETTLAAGTNYYIFASIAFAELDYNDDTSIALRDATTKQFIETSTRYYFDTEIVLVANTGQQPSLVVNGRVTYHVANATWDSGTSAWAYTDQLNTIDRTYSDAMVDIINSVKREITGTDIDVSVFTADPDIKLQKLTDSAIRLYTTNPSGKRLANLEQVYANNVWTPMLWMMPDAALFPVLRLTPDGMLVYNSFENTTKLSYNSLAMSNPVSQFEVDSNKFRYRYAGLNALSITGEAESSTSMNADVFLVAEETDEGTPIQPDPGYETFMTLRNGASPYVGSYKFTLARADVPYNKMFTLNHKITTISTTSINYTTAILQMDIYWEMDDDPGTWRFVGTHTFPLLSSQRVITESTNIFCPASSGGAGSYVNFSMKLVYTVLPQEDNGTTVVQIGAKVDENVVWTKQTAPFPLTEIKYLKLGATMLWVDSSNRLRMKAIPQTPGTVITGISGEPGSSLSDPGGVQILAGGLSTINISSVFQTPSNVPDWEDVIRHPYWDAATSTLHIPRVGYLASADHRWNVDAGTISSSQFRSIWDHINTLMASITTPPPTLEKVLYVSPNYVIPGTTNDFGYPFFSKIQNAIDYVYSHFQNAGAVITVEPGVYNENILLGTNDGDNKISIIARSPRDTKIMGTVRDRSGDMSYANVAYIDIPIENSTGHCIQSTEQTNNFTFGPNATITETGNFIAVYVQAGTVTCFGDINHTLASGTTAGVSVSEGAYFYSKRNRIYCNNFSPLQVAGDFNYLTNVTLVCSATVTESVRNIAGVAKSISAIGCAATKALGSLMTNAYAVNISGTDVNYLVISNLE